MTTYTQSSFLGGEWSKTMQARFDRPDYRTAMNVCLNGLMTETGAWTRRIGTRHAGISRGGVKAKTIPFAFEEDMPYVMEFTAGHLRFWRGLDLVHTNDSQVVTSISGANPALVAVPAVNTWVTGDQVFFTGLDVNTPLLMNRCFIWTKVSTTSGTLTDAITGATINGSTLGTLAATATVNRALDIVTPFSESLCQVMRSVQAEFQAVLLTGTLPQILTATLPTGTQTYATFTLAATNFLDGPYLDPPTNGVLITPSGLSGNINLALSFGPFDITRSYTAGDYVTFSSQCWRCMVSGIVGNTPSVLPGSNWTAVDAGVAIGPNGFLPTDIGRSIRMLATNGWTWGTIIGLINSIPYNLAGAANFGDMTSNAGLAAAFDGNISKSGATSAMGQIINTLAGGEGTVFSSEVGRNFSGASDQRISTATVYPATDTGFVTATGISILNGVNVDLNGRGFVTLTFTLYGKSSLPSSATDGTVLGATSTAGTDTRPQVITSADIVTAWKYVWVLVTTTMSANFQIGNYQISNFISQVTLQSPSGSGVSSNGCTVQIRGDHLPNANAMGVWRLGLIASAQSWPTCGTYHEGRLWLSGVLGNRIDGSMSGQLFNFAPTSKAGTVADSNAVSYTFDGPDVNTIFWMLPDQQGIICGTLAGEWLVQASNINSPLTPTSMQAHRVTTIGGANAEPRRSEHTVVFIQKHQQKIMEYFADVYSGKFSAPNVTMTAKHLTARVLEELAYQQELAPVIWARCADGSLIGVSYKRDSLLSAQGPTYAGAHRHTLGSGRVIESLCVGPSPATATAAAGQTDTLVLATNDPITNIRHIEFLTPLFMEGTPDTQAWFLDDAVAPLASQNVVLGGVSSLQLSGLWHLNGSTVSVFCGGLDCGDFAVSSGQCAVPYGSANGLFTTDFVASFAGSMPIVVGFTYTSDGQMVRPISVQDSGARSGPALGKLRRTDNVTALLHQTQGISFGTEFDKLIPARFTTPGGTAYAANTLFSGIHRMAIKDSDSFDSMICWRVTRPYPATVAAVQGSLDTKDH